MQNYINKKIIYLTEITTKDKLSLFEDTSSKVGKGFVDFESNNKQVIKQMLTRKLILKKEIIARLGNPIGGGNIEKAATWSCPCNDTVGGGISCNIEICRTEVWKCPTYQPKDPECSMLGCAGGDTSIPFINCPPDSNNINCSNLACMSYGYHYGCASIPAIDCMLSDPIENCNETDNCPIT